MVSRLFHCVKVKALAVDFRADLGDPADTAMIVGAMSQVAMFATLWSPYSCRLVPAFEGEPLLDGEAELAVRVRPVSIVPPLFGFVFSSSTLKALVLVIRSRWKKDD